MLIFWTSIPHYFEYLCMYWGKIKKCGDICWINVKISNDSSKLKGQRISMYGFCFIDYILKPLTMWITTNCGKFLKRWEYQAISSASWETCTQVKKQQLEPDMEQGCILSLWLLNLYAEYIMWNAGLDEAQAGIKIVGRNISNLRYTDNTTLMAEIKRN